MLKNGESLLPFGYAEIKEGVIGVLCLVDLGLDRVSLSLRKGVVGTVDLVYQESRKVSWALLLTCVLAAAG